MMDEYKVHTPEQIAIGYTVAGLGTRFLALAIDSLIQIAVLAGLLYSLFALASYTSWYADWYVALVIILAAVVLFGYFMVFELLLKGRTPGKAALKLRVVRMDGRAADLSGIVLRNLIRLIDFLPVLYTVGVITMFVNKDSRRLGDLAGGTVVIVERKAATLDSLLSQQPAEPTTQLTDSEYGIIRDFLARCHQLAPQDRYRLATTIAEPLFHRLGVPSEHRGNPEGFLRSLLMEPLN